MNRIELYTFIISMLIFIAALIYAIPKMIKSGLLFFAKYHQRTRHQKAKRQKLAELASDFVPYWIIGCMAILCMIGEIIWFFKFSTIWPNL